MASILTVNMGGAHFHLGSYFGHEASQVLGHGHINCLAGQVQVQINDRIGTGWPQLEDQLSSMKLTDIQLWIVLFFIVSCKV